MCVLAALRAIKASAWLSLGCIFQSQIIAQSFVPTPDSTPESLAAGFVSPPQWAKPYTWWHWMNGNVRKEGITLDLEAMKRVGIGGFQIFQVGSAIPQGPVIFGSPEHLQLIDFAVKEADRLGLEFGMESCPGWASSGGPWITPELSMQILTFTETQVIGGQKVSVMLPQPASLMNYYRDAFILAFPTPAAQARIADANTKANFPNGTRVRYTSPPPLPVPVESAGTDVIDPSTVLDVSANMNAQGQLDWNAPPGNWTLLRIGYTTVGAENHPAPDGAMGLEVDKFNAAAMDFHFEHMFGKLYDILRPLIAKGVAGAVIDSYESGLQNWTPSFPQEFQKRNGYDLKKYMPAMTGRVVGSTEISDRFLWDVRKTQADLMAENYYSRFVELCHQHGMKSIIEPYSSLGPSNIDEESSAAYPDVPMAEFWGNSDTSHSVKTVASAAHVNGKPVVAAESFTGRRSRWVEYPYILKSLGDYMYTQGLNRITFHSFAMQPDPTAVPGMTMGPWGANFNRNNTWFEQGRAWITYLTRCQYLLQQGHFVADLLYFDGEDSPLSTPDRRALNPAVPQGYDYDTTDTKTILTRLKIVDGRIILPDGLSYRVMVLPNNATMTLPLMRKIHDLVEQGMTLVAGGFAPANTPGLSGYPASDTELKRLGSELWGDINSTTVTEHAFGKGRVVAGQPLSGVLANMNAQPDFQYTSHGRNSLIYFVHRHIGDSDAYFIANHSSQPEDLVGEFNVAGKQPEFWKPDTGQIIPAALYDSSNGGTRMPIQLDPAESVFVVFRSPAPAQHFQSVSKDGTILASTDAYPPSQDRAAVSATARMTNPAQNLPMPESPEPPTVDVAGTAKGALLAWENGMYALRDNKTQTTTKQVSSISPPQEISGPWRVTFPPKLGAPPEVTLDRLVSWSDYSDEGVKYFSGTATYFKTFNVPADAITGGKRLFLDLGRVAYLAEVLIDGKNLGILWKPPFRMDITDAVHAGSNELEVRVTNLWTNRLIGDEHLAAENQYTTVGTPDSGNMEGAITQMPDWYANGQPKPTGGRTTFTTWRFFNGNEPLSESGLIGPVLLRQAVPLAP